MKNEPSDALIVCPINAYCEGGGILKESYHQIPFVRLTCQSRNNNVCLSGWSLNSLMSSCSSTLSIRPEFFLIISAQIVLLFSDFHCVNGTSMYSLKDVPKTRLWRNTTLCNTFSSIHKVSFSLVHSMPMD